MITSRPLDTGHPCVSFIKEYDYLFGMVESQEELFRYLSESDNNSNSEKNLAVQPLIQEAKKICKNGKLWGDNGCYNNSEYIKKQRIAQHKRYGTLDKLDLSIPLSINKKYIKSDRKKQKEYLKSDRNPFNTINIYKFKKENQAWNKWKLWDEKQRKKISEGVKKAYREGHILSESKNKKSSELLKERWRKDGEKMVSSLLKGLIKRPLSTEKKLNEILQRNFPNEWKYTGDGSFLIGYKNPDFINVNGKRICIEVYYDFFKIRDFGSCENYEKQRSEHFAKYGWKTIFIKYEELTKEDVILQKLQLVKN